MYNNMYGYNQQMAQTRIDDEIAKLQQLKGQLNQPSINQTFQLAPQNGMRYAKSIEDVQKEMVYTDTPYFSNDLSVVWLKNAKGSIRAFEMKEIVKKDEKDLLIESLKMRLDEMEEKLNARSTNTDVIEPSEDEEPKNFPIGRTSKKK